MDTFCWVCIWQTKTSYVYHTYSSYARFSKPFTIESDDGCDNGLGVVLLQDEHPIVFTIKSLSGKNLSASKFPYHSYFPMVIPL